MLELRERRKEVGYARPVDQSGDGAFDDLHYVAKLKRSKRPRELTAAVLLLLLFVRRMPPDALTSLQLRIVLYSPTLAVARALSAYVARQTGQTLDPNPIADGLRQAIVEHALRAAATLKGNALSARLGLIVQAEVQQATARAIRAVAHLLQAIVRSTTSDTPCDPCEDAAGTYYPPYPEDLWYTHPRCACVWAAA